jgi:hypothetical protein
MTPASDDPHPVDALVLRRCRDDARTRRILQSSKTLMRALGNRNGCWLELEQLLNARHADLEAAYFDVGFEQGRIAGRQQALRAFRPGGSRKEPALARRIRAALDAPGGQADQIAALLIVAWSLALDHAARPGA